MIPRKNVIRNLKSTGNEHDARTAKYMEDDPTMSQGRAAIAAHGDMAREQADAFHAAQDEPRHWGNDPWCLANVGLN